MHEVTIHYWLPLLAAVAHALAFATSFIRCERCASGKPRSGFLSELREAVAVREPVLKQSLGSSERSHGHESPGWHTKIAGPVATHEALM